MAQLNVNLTQDQAKDQDAAGGVVPQDRYALQIVEGEVKRNSKGTGDIFEFKAEVIDGEYTGRKVFERINVTNASATAQKIGQGQLSALALAAGIDPATLNDTDQLLYQPFRADVVIEPYKDKNGNDKESNKIKKYIHAGNEHEPPPSKETPVVANDNKRNAAPANDNKPQGVAATVPPGKPNMPWKKTG